MQYPFVDFKNNATQAEGEQDITVSFGQDTQVTRQIINFFIIPFANEDRSFALKLRRTDTSNPPLSVEFLLFNGYYSQTLKTIELQQLRGFVLQPGETFVISSDLAWNVNLICNYVVFRNASQVSYDSTNLIRDEDDENNGEGEGGN